MTFKIAICAGHGYNTAGKRTPNGEREWTFNDKVASSFIEEINNYENVEVRRFDDPTGKTDVPLSTRTNNANSWKADIYISFHHNANTGKWGTWTGVETFYAHGSSNGKKLAECVHPEVVKAYGLKNRGLKTNNLHITRQTKMPAILIEGGFMDSTIDIVKLRDNNVLKNAGIGVALGVAKYANLKRKKSSSSSSGTTPSKTTDNKTNTTTKPSTPSSSNSKVNTIKNIQSNLNKLYKTGLKVDGIYGANTKRALVKGYQTELNRYYGTKLVVDGIWGRNTKNATRTVSIGSKNNRLVWILQATLYCLGFDPKGIDGIFGANTQSALKRFQSSRKISSDGIAGKQTFEKLFS